MPEELSDQLPVIASEDGFEARVLAAETLALVGFWADWSGACHVMTPVLEAIARNREGRIEVILVDVDRAPGLKTRYGVRSVPALLFFDGGRPVDRVVGTTPRKALAERVDALLSGRAGEEG